MVSFTFTHLVALLSALANLSGVFSTPVINGSEFQGLDNNAHDTLESFILTGPRWMIYSDSSISGITGPPPVSQINGFNVFALSFLLTNGPFDNAFEWTTLTPKRRKTIKSQYADAGVKIVVSLFGDSDTPTSNRADPVATANTMAAWAIEYDMDGVDVDYEDFNAIDAGDGRAEAWLVTFTKQLRKRLQKGSYILTHAPVAPWFSPGKFRGGAYLTVDRTVGDLIDWYNVQFYNQGSSEYTTCTGLLTKSSKSWPSSSLFEIADSGIPLNKLVIGKPATRRDANQGFMSPSTLSSCLEKAKSNGWHAGVMVFEFPHADSSWIKTVRSRSFPE